MVAYSFNPRFELPILSGAKSGTIRAIGRRRHARAGETLQLYVGQRTRHCRLLGTAFCTSVDPIQLLITNQGGGPNVDFIDIGEERGPGRRAWSISHRGMIDEFARGDGFLDSQAMADFWWSNHREFREGGRIVFTGVWIRWAPLGGPHGVD